MKEATPPKPRYKGDSQIISTSMRTELVDMEIRYTVRRKGVTRQIKM